MIELATVVISSVLFTCGVGILYGGKYPDPYKNKDYYRGVEK